jgi:hypothetical protein
MPEQDAVPRTADIGEIWDLQVAHPDMFDLILVSVLNSYSDDVLSGMLSSMRKAVGQ